MAEKQQKEALMVVANNLVTQVENKVNDMINTNRIDLPADYSVGNALKSMQLAIVQTENKDHRPALEVCTKESVIQCMLSMVVQGLNPDKKQCYPIVYGNKLTLFRSYFGAMAVAYRVDPNIESIVAQVVYKSEKDNFKMITQPNGRYLVTQHVPDIFGSRKIEDIVGAYATVLYKDGTGWSDFRNFDQIKEAWKHSQVKPIDEKGNIKETTTHYKEYEDMCRRTLINRVCKVIINASSDASIIAQFAKQTQRDMDRAEAEDRIDSNLAAGDFVDIEEDNTVMEAVDAPAETKDQASEPATEKAAEFIPEMAGADNPFGEE